MKLFKKIMFVALFSILIIFYNISVFPQTDYALSDKYDSRNYHIITPVRDQGSSNLCWVYSSINASEASLLKSGTESIKTNREYLISPLHAAYACQTRGVDPLNNTADVISGNDYMSAKGNPGYISSLYSQWCGPVKAENKINCNGFENAAYILKDSFHIDGNNLTTSEDARYELKNLIVKYGGVTFSYYNGREVYYYNPKNETSSSSVSHACTIIGWDDTIPADSFQPGGASQNGGWLIKNSYSSMPYFYLSYDNTSTNIYTFSYLPKSTYDFNYFYDSDIKDFNLASIIYPKKIANVFTAKKGSENYDEYITAVNIGINGKNIETKVTVSVYTDLKNSSDPTSGTLEEKEEVTIKYSGYHTINLSNPVNVENGKEFSVVAEVENSSDFFFKLTEDKGNGFIKRHSNWTKFDGSPRIKAYTKLSDKINDTTTDKIVFDDNKFSIFLSSDNGADFILCLYEDNRLADVKIFDITEKNTDISIPTKWAKGTGKRVRGFLWKSIQSMEPIDYKSINWERDITS